MSWLTHEQIMTKGFPWRVYVSSTNGNLQGEDTKEKKTHGKIQKKKIQKKEKEKKNTCTHRDGTGFNTFHKLSFIT